MQVIARPFPALPKPVAAVEFYVFSAQTCCLSLPDYRGSCVVLCFASMELDHCQHRSLILVLHHVHVAGMPSLLVTRPRPPTLQASMHCSMGLSRTTTPSLARGFLGWTTFQTTSTTYGSSSGRCAHLPMIVLNEMARGCLPLNNE